MTFGHFCNRRTVAVRLSAYRESTCAVDDKAYQSSRVIVLRSKFGLPLGLVRVFFFFFRNGIINLVVLEKATVC